VAPKLFEKVKPWVKQKHDCFVLVLNKSVNEQLRRLEVDFDATLEFGVDQTMILRTFVDMVDNIQVVCSRAERVYFLFVVLLLQSIVDLKDLGW